MPLLLQTILLFLGAYAIGLAAAALIWGRS
jgi:hypothetical protein